MHRLHFNWTFWKDDFSEKNASKTQFESNLLELDSCGTIEDFWSAFSKLPSLELLQQKKITLHFMRKGIKPMWEDPKNVDGGTITIKCKKEDTSKIWKEALVLAISGEESLMHTVGEITGISISMKKSNNLLIIWLNSTNTNYHDVVTNYILNTFTMLKMEDVNWRENNTHASFSN
ncbi:eukaryotic translation initiation factor 4E type [Entamoeba marina]